MQSWARILESFRIPDAFRISLDRTPVLDAIVNLFHRLRDGPSRPFRAVFLGPTGAGKSKVFNSLLGKTLSPSSYRRPFTERAVYYAPVQWRKSLEGLDGELITHADPEWDRWVLIDVPDFDSVESAHHQIAARVYEPADVVVVVADVHKYGDAALWNYLRRIKLQGKRAVFVLNKLQHGSGVAEDFQRQLQAMYSEAAVPGPICRISFYPQDDQALIPSQDPGLRDLRLVFAALQAQSRELVPETFRRSLEQLLEAWKRFRERLHSCAELSRTLNQALDLAHGGALRGLEEKLDQQVDLAVKDEMRQELLKRFERIDILRYPRKWIAYPFVEIRRYLERWFPRLSERAAGVQTQAAQAETLDRNFPALESLILKFHEDLNASWSAAAGADRSLEEAARPPPVISHDELLREYGERMQAYKNWAFEEAQATASRLTGENKLKFILSQVIFNTVLVGVQLKTGGLLTLGEILFDGLLSPLAAKGAGILLSNSQVRAFEESARRKFFDHAREVLALARRRFDQHLERQALDLASVQEVDGEIEALEGKKEILVRDFQGSTPA